MAHYLIIGRSGTGKTTLWREFLKQGYTAFDGDKVPGLARWIDLSTGQPINKDYPGDDHIGKFEWQWNPAVLTQLLKDHKDLFLCGNADNVRDFYALFDRVFILDLDETAHRQRIMQRQEHDYGKDPAVQNEVIREQQKLVDEVVSRGAIAIDAHMSPPEIVKTILENV